MAKNRNRTLIYLAVLIAIALLTVFLRPSAEPFDLTEIPEYSGQPWVELNQNIPEFEDLNPRKNDFEQYSHLDYLGRCGPAYACLSRELMPTQERESISEVRPSGWQSARYSFIDGESLYNRCHLIGFQLAGENANERNLITGTRYMNTEGMLPFEEEVASYIRLTGNRVLYRVTPVYVDDEPVARGVRMEAWSVEDQGEGICFHVFCYNVQPGIVIDYETGDNYEAEFSCSHADIKLVLNTSSFKYHLPTCSGATDMNPNNREEVFCCPEEAEAKGYQPCGSCQPGKTKS